MLLFSFVLAQSFGILAFPVDQFGHCAFVYLDLNYDRMFLDGKRVLDIIQHCHICS